MHVDQSYQKLSNRQYVEALLNCSDKKVCTNLAKTMNVTHDSMYRNFKDPIEQTKNTLEDLKSMAIQNLNLNDLYLIFDDTQITKLYAQEIEGLEVGFDGSLGMPALGIKMVTALLTDKNINVPIDAIPYISKELAQCHYKTKSDIAIEITRHIIKLFKIKFVLGDAHYATHKKIKFLREQQLQYLMKIPCNRVVTINGLSGQLKHILRLKKNNRIRVVRGIFKDVECYFYVVKIKNGTTVYFVSNEQIDLCKVIEIYRIRWNIELFHRTGKQYLGLGDCQMKAIEKQRQHVIFVMLAYAIAGVQRKLLNLNCVEDVINNIRDAKTNRCCYAFPAVEANLCYVA